MDAMRSGVDYYVSLFVGMGGFGNKVVTWGCRTQNPTTTMVSNVSRDDAVKQQEVAIKEIDALRGELQKLREDRESHLSEIQDLKSEILRYKDSTGHTAAECNILNLKLIALEETCSTQREQISVLECQLAAANKKLKELEGVFCKVRSMHTDDAYGSDATVSYPNSVELVGRDIDISQSGHITPCSFEKVVKHNASQEDAFMETSQLLQSAPDGYKVMKELEACREECKAITERLALAEEKFMEKLVKMEALRNDVRLLVNQKKASENIAVEYIIYEFSILLKEHIVNSKSLNIPSWFARLHELREHKSCLL